MSNFLKVTTLLVIISVNSYAQNNFTYSPDSAQFVTSDIENFWKAFDDFKKDSTVNNFGSKYIAIGSPGVKGFLDNRIQSAEHLYAVVKKRSEAYAKVRPNTLKIKEKERQSRSTFYALKYLYPKAKFPPVYFVIGAYNSGGTSNSVGLIIGAEKQNNIDGLPYIIAHELIHFQQIWPGNDPTLLQQSILEGSADFIGGLISGGTINAEANDYGNKHEDELCREFVLKMNGADYNDWLYGTSKKDNRPNDLGYWMGYRIAEAYYNKTSDKKQAIDDILNIKDYQNFLVRSGYLAKYLK